MQEYKQMQEDKKTISYLKDIADIFLIKYLICKILSNIFCAKFRNMFLMEFICRTLLPVETRR